MLGFDKKYEYVTEINRTGNISMAADNLGITQPTLSKFLKGIESELGCKLFDRTKSPLELTDAGRCFLEYGEKFFIINKEFKKRLNNCIENHNESIRIGISPSRATYLMPEILKEFSSEGLNCKLYIEEGNTEKLNYAFKNGSIDMMITVEENINRNFPHCELFKESLFLAVPYKCRNMSMEEALKELPLIELGRRQILTKTMLSITGDKPKIVCCNIDTAVSLVKAGLGVTLVPSYIKDYSKDESAKVCFLPIKKEISNCEERTVSLFYNNVDFISGNQKALLKCIKKLTMGKGSDECDTRN